MKLISMMDFVLNEANQAASREYSKVFAFEKMLAYANFLNQPIKLGMFIPCSIGGQPFTDFTRTDSFFIEAKERILFEGFEICNRNSNLDCIVNDDLHLSIDWFKDKTIDYLVQYNLKLTENQSEKLNLWYY